MNVYITESNVYKKKHATWISMKHQSYHRDSLSSLRYLDRCRRRRARIRERRPRQLKRFSRQRIRRGKTLNVAVSVNAFNIDSHDIQLDHLELKSYAPDCNSCRHSRHTTILSSLPFFDHLSGNSSLPLSETSTSHLSAYLLFVIYYFAPSKL